MNTTTGPRKCHCAEVHALPITVEDFEQDRGFSLYDLPWTYDGREAETLTWETITPDSDYRAALRYFEALAAEHLADGTISHYCG